MNTRSEIFAAGDIVKTTCYGLFGRKRRTRSYIDGAEDGCTNDQMPNSQI